MKNDEQRLPFDEVKAFSKRLNNTIRDWAVKTFGEQCAHIVLDQVRLLAWRASVNRQSPGKYMLTQKEAIAFMEAAEDIIAVVDSIRRKAITGRRFDMTDMEKVETDNIAVVQARALKKYCADHEGCCGCVFDDYDEEGQPVCKIAPANEHYTILCPMDWEV